MTPQRHDREPWPIVPPGDVIGFLLCLLAMIVTGASGSHILWLS